jgi:HSP20 family protein
MVFFRKTKIKEQREETKQNKTWFQAEGKLMVDVYETKSFIIVQAPIAGANIEDFDIFIENDILEIKGTRENPRENNTKMKYCFNECYWGPFSRKIILPKEVDNSRIKASIKEGVLIVKMPKIEKEKRRKVRIEDE